MQALVSISAAVSGPPRAFLSTASENTARTFTAPDGAINVVRPYGKGHLEARLLYRDLDDSEAKRRACLYLSSHSGCRMGCRFCFLTQQKQTSMKHSTVEQYVSQASEMLGHHVEGGLKVARLHYNFMARGEPLANNAVINRWSELSAGLHRAAYTLGGFDSVRCNISTIMPSVVAPHDLRDVFGHLPPWLYYSLYSLDPAFRAHWMPNAMPVVAALDKLAALQRENEQPITFHWAVIRGANDDLDNAHAIAKLIKEYDFDGRFSLVRYNPHPNSQSSEAAPERLAEIHQILSSAVKSSKIISRVGFEAYASCGMFPADDD